MDTEWSILGTEEVSWTLLGYSECWGSILGTACWPRRTRFMSFGIVSYFPRIIKFKHTTNYCVHLHMTPIGIQPSCMKAEACVGHWLLYIWPTAVFSILSWALFCYYLLQIHCRHFDPLLCCCCISLRPSNGGQDCPGVNFEYQLCNTDDCPKHFEDFRAQQCQLRNSHFEFQNTKHHWLPYEHPDGKPVKCQHIVEAFTWS